MKLNRDKLKVVIFDWDGTLAQSSPPRISAVNRVLKNYNLPEWEISKKLRDENLSFMDNFPRIFRQNSSAAYEMYCRFYLENIREAFYGFEGAESVIEKLRSFGVKIAIMTNKDRRLLEQELPLIYPIIYFDKIVCGHEAPRDKPCKEHALYTLQGLIDVKDITPDTVWIIGDSKLDSLCAAGINALPIRINNIICGDELQKCQNLICFRDYNELYSAIE